MVVACDQHSDFCLSKQFHFDYIGSSDFVPMQFRNAAVKCRNAKTFGNRTPLYSYYWWQNFPSDSGAWHKMLNPKVKASEWALNMLRLS